MDIETLKNANKFLDEESVEERTVPYKNVFNIEFDLGNAEFDDEGYISIPAIDNIFKSIRNALEKQKIILNQKFEMPLIDSNGNTIGTAKTGLE